MHINVIGAGLAGCEAAMQIASRGIKVHLYEMKPNKKTPAHLTEKYAELVCSNSLKAMRVESAAAGGDVGHLVAQDKIRTTGGEYPTAKTGDG